MTGTNDGPQSPSSTEDVPSAPGWVEQSVDEIFFTLRQGPSTNKLRNAYLDCLASTRSPEDIDAAHDRCRQTLIKALREQEHVAGPALASLELKLEALEAAISERI